MTSRAGTAGARPAMSWLDANDAPAFTIEHQIRGGSSLDGSRRLAWSQVNTQGELPSGGVAVLAALADFAAAGDRIPGGFGPCDLL